MNIAGWDLATRKIGVVHGDGSEVPVGEAIILPQCGDDIGLMVHCFHVELVAFHKRSPCGVWVFEAPIIPTGGFKGKQAPVFGSVLQRRKQLAIYSHLEWFAYEHGLVCEEDTLQALKKELAGSKSAPKANMVACALKLGVKLPLTDSGGRVDVADALAAWLIGVRHHAKSYSARWDSKLYSSRGALL